ncbi:hypothetical protein Tco_1339036 [Tanacetum coccineum]
MSKSPLKLVDEPIDEGVPVEEPAYNEEEANLQRALELRIKEQEERTSGPARQVIFREPDSRRLQPLHEVQGKGKEKVIEEQASHDLLTLHTLKKKSPADLFIFQRRTSMTTGPSRDESPSFDTELALTDSEQSLMRKCLQLTQKRMHPIGSSLRSILEIKMKTKLDQTLVNKMKARQDQTLITNASTQQYPEQMDEEFTTTAYPNVQENLKLATEDQVILEEPASSTGTLSSLHNLDKELSFTN